MVIDTALISAGISAAVTLIISFASAQYRLGKTTGHIEAIVRSREQIR